MKKLILPILLLISGCASTVKVEKSTYPHMISLNPSGETFNIQIIPDSNHRHDDIHDDIIDLSASKQDRLGRHIEKIKLNLKRFIDKKESKHIDKEIMIFTHGGLISKKASSKAATILHNAIHADNDLCRSEIAEALDKRGRCNVIYPIFINWESGMGSAYADHLFYVRQGKEAPVLGPITSPFYFVADVGRAITRLPITYSYQGYDAVRSIDVASENYIKKINKGFYTRLNIDSQVSLGKSNTNSGRQFIDKATYIFPGIFKLITTPILDTVGKSAWDNMLRRTKTVFRTPDDYHGKFGRTNGCTKEDTNVALDRLNSVPFNEDDFCDDGLYLKQEMGGVSRLLRAINEVSGNGGNSKASFTLIGHSMGAIISSRILGKLLEDKNYSNIRFDNIVFMAAASTIRQFEDNVIPYLQKHENTKFYNLTLHPYSEENEQTGYDSVPRGSLLVWIDNYAASPDTITDLTLGKWNNSVRMLPFIPIGIRDRVSLKGFGVYDKVINRAGLKEKYNKPQKHGQFNDADQCFWRKEYWRPVKNTGYRICEYSEMK